MCGLAGTVYGEDGGLLYLFVGGSATNKVQYVPILTALTETLLVPGTNFVNQEELVRTTMLTGGERDGKRTGNAEVINVKKYGQGRKKNLFRTAEIAAGAIVIGVREIPDKDGI